MLVLSRRIGQKILIGNDISIEVRRVAGNRVTLAVEAPLDVRILRDELKEEERQSEGGDS
jgi:carbon storage regulator